MQDAGYKPKGRRLERTSTPGVFKRGGSYVVIVRDPSGKQRKHAAKTLAAARALKASLTTDVQRGEYREQSRLTFIEYAPEWLDSYAGRTTRGFRENTRNEYRRDLGFDESGHPVDRAAAFFGKMRLAEIEPRTVKRYVARLAEDGVSPATIRKRLAPLRALFATAVEDGLIRFNPAAGIRVPASSKPEQVKPKALTEDEVRRLLVTIAPESRLLVDFLLHTGLRFSEMSALEWRDVDFGAKRIFVRRRYYKGMGKPKSRFGVREVPLTPAMAQRLWQLRKDMKPAADNSLVFRTPEGARLDYANTYNRILKPAMRAAEIKDGGFHRFRHTCGTHLYRNGARDVQVQMWLGHHDPGFTARTYVHLEPGDLPDPSIFEELTRSLDRVDVAQSHDDSLAQTG
jgi:integrase